MVDTKTKQAIAKAIVKEYLGRYAEDVYKRIDEIKFDVNYGKSSEFNSDNKTIYIDAKYLHDINIYVHELLHAISTNYPDNKKLVGFNKFEYTKLENGETLHTNFGYGINEGATHSMTVEATAERFGKVGYVYSYAFCIYTRSVVFTAVNRFGSDFYSDTKRSHRNFRFGGEFFLRLE